MDKADILTAAPWVRLGSLAVAAACCQLGAPPDLVQRYLDLAAAITAAERRASGENRPSEVIMLVRG